MCCFHAFCRSAPSDLCLNREAGGHAYRYFLEGKGCVLGVLFHTSTHVAFEWIGEGGALVSYDAPTRYRMWTKHEVARLMRKGVYQVEREARLSGYSCLSAAA
jgi:hypothetical protein